MYLWRKARQVWVSKTFVMKAHIMLQALSVLQAQRERLRAYEQIGEQERGKLATIDQEAQFLRGGLWQHSLCQ